VTELGPCPICTAASAPPQHDSAIDASLLLLLLQLLAILRVCNPSSVTLEFKDFQRPFQRFFKQRNVSFPRGVQARTPAKTEFRNI